jgi:hypothetical protein
MQAPLALYLGILFYTAVAAWWSVVFDYGLLSSTLIMLGVPVAVWWYELHPSKVFVWAAGSIAIATAIIFETIAHTSGLWLSVSPLQFRVFGLFPVETLLYNAFLYFYLIFFHEFLVDDKRLHHTVLDTKKKQLLALVFGTMLVILYVLLMSGRFVIPYGFTMLLIGLIVAISIAVLMSHITPWRVLHKALLTTALVLPIMVLLEAVAAMNVLTVFANPAQYLFAVEILGVLIPVEQVLYMLLAPIWVVTIYELYFDDAR